MKICASAGNQTSAPCFPAWRFNHSAFGTVNDMLLKLLHYVLYAIISQQVRQHKYESVDL